MWNLGDGFAKGIYENHRGLDEKREYEELSKQRELARQRTQQIMDKDKLEMQEMKNKLYLQNIEIQKVLATAEADRGRKDLVNFVEAIQKNKGKNVTIEDEIVSPDKLPEGFDPKNYTQNEDGTYTRKIAKYGKADDILKSEENMNERWVYNTDGARWINNVLNTVDNPVTNVSYDPQQDEINFRLRDGSYISYPPSVVYAATGMDKLGSLAERNLMEQQRADFIANQKVMESKLKNDETQMKIRTGDIEANAKMITAGAAASNARTNEFEALSKAQIENRKLDLLEQGKGPRTEGQRKAEEKEADREWEQKTLAIQDDQQFLKTLTSDTDKYTKYIAKTQSKQKAVNDALVAGTIAYRWRELGSMLDRYKDKSGNITLDEAAVKQVNQYFGIKNDFVSVDTTNQMAYLTAIANQIATDAIKAKSGAAFSERELNMQLGDALAAITNGKTIENGLASIKGMYRGWDDTYETNLAVLGTEIAKRYVSANIAQRGKIKNIISTDLDKSVLFGTAVEMSKASPEERESWYNSLTDGQKLWLKEGRKAGKL
jgi:hypothetical protein|nr:MAG TPA: hypothetical protein [Caudoviricetes sp.]